LPATSIHETFTPLAPRRITTPGDPRAESQDRTRTLDSDYLRFGIQRFECDGSVSSDGAFSESGDDVAFTYTRSLATASVDGTLTTVEGRTVTVDMSWSGLRRVEVRKSQNRFPGGSNSFRGMRGDAVATGTVVYDGDAVVNGSTTNAELESLEDTNVTR